MEILSLIFDAKLIPWVFVVNILGLWLKRMKLPEWAPPIPLLLWRPSWCARFSAGYILISTMVKLLRR